MLMGAAPKLVPCIVAIAITSTAPSAREYRSREVSVGAVTGAFSPRPSYAYPYRGYVAHGGCRWMPAHYNRWGEWRQGHCARY